MSVDAPWPELAAQRRPFEVVVTVPRKDDGEPLVPRALPRGTRLLVSRPACGLGDGAGLATGLPNLELGIIPLEAPVSVFPRSGFRLYDDLVIVEHINGEQQLSDTDEVTRYESYLQMLRDAAVYGDDLAAVFRRSLDALW